MSTLILRPNGNVSNGQLTNVSDNVSSYTNIDEETLSTADYNRSWTFSASAWMTDIYSLPNHTTESGTINSVTVKGYCSIVDGANGTGGATYVDPALKIGSTIYLGEGQTLSKSTTTIYSKTWLTNPATSSAWGSDWSVIDNLMAGDSLYSAYGNLKDWYSSGICYQLWVEVDYTEGGGSPIVIPQIQIF